MKILVAIVGWGAALIVATISFSVMKHETKWRDVEILKLRGEVKSQRQKTTNAERIHLEKMEKVRAMVEKLGKVRELENEAHEIGDRVEQLRLRRAAMTDFGARESSILKEAAEVGRLEQIAEELTRVR